MRFNTVCQQLIARGPQRQVQYGLLTSRGRPIQGIQCIYQGDSFNRSRIHFGVALQLRYKSDTTPSKATKTEDLGISKKYSFEEISKIVASPSPGRILIDAREPSELQSTGRIPGAKNLPINSSPDGLFLPAEDFEEKFGWEKPKSSDELIFYCKAGVRSRAAAGIARTAGWKDVSEYPGSWLDWVKHGGKIEP